MISRRDLGIFTFVETAQEGWDVVKAFYRDSPVEGLPIE
jgi:hypothetical protein